MPHSLHKYSVTLTLLVATSVCAAGSEKLATRLLDVSGLNLIYAQGILAGYKKSAADTKRPAQEVSCLVEKITPELTMQALASGYAQEFDDQELQSAVSFFETKAGRKYAQYQRVKSSEFFGMRPQEKEPELAPRELEAINAFLETRIGKLILSTNSPMSASAKTVLQPKLAAYRDQCAKSQ